MTSPCVWNIGDFEFSGPEEECLTWPVLFFSLIVGNDAGLRGNLSGACVWVRPGVRGFVSGSEPAGSAGHGLWPTRRPGRSRRSRLLQEAEKGEAAHAGECRALVPVTVITRTPFLFLLKVFIFSLVESPPCLFCHPTGLHGWFCW